MQKPQKVTENMLMQDSLGAVLDLTFGGCLEMY
jgi:hypothetical protein